MFKKVLALAAVIAAVASPLHAQVYGGGHEGQFTDIVANAAAPMMDATVADWCGLRPHGYSATVRDGIIKALKVQAYDFWPNNPNERLVMLSRANQALSGVYEITVPRITHEDCEQVAESGNLNKTDNWASVALARK